MKRPRLTTRIAHGLLDCTALTTAGPIEPPADEQRVHAAHEWARRAAGGRTEPITLAIVHGLLDCTALTTAGPMEPAYEQRMLDAHGWAVRMRTWLEQTGKVEP